MQKFTDISMHFEGVTAVRGNQTLFADLSFKLNSGEVMWIQGANGIGKTTLLRLATGLARPDSGQITWLKGESLLDSPSAVAFQGHRNALKPQLTAAEDLQFWSRIYHYADNLKDIFERVGLAHRQNTACRALSAGQARRLAIARLLISQRPIWVMDEPAAAMDKDGQALILGVVNEHIKQGGAALIASHDQARSFSGPTSRLTLETAL